MNRKIAAMLSQALAGPCATGDVDAAVRAVYELFTTPDASKSLVRVNLTSRGGYVDGQQIGESEDRTVRYCGKVIGTRYHVDGVVREHVDVRAAGTYPHLHPSEDDVRGLLRGDDGIEIGSHYLLAECDLT